MVGRVTPARLHIGCAGWSVASGRAEFAGTGSVLERYAAVLDAVEINSSFYKPHRRATYTKWAASTPPGFRFSVKAPRAVTHTAKYREPFEPLPGRVDFVPFGDLRALEAAVDDTTAAVLVEAIQGENGIVGLPEGYLAAARRITQEAGALLWIDEVQTGIGRCGELLLHRADGVTADLVTVAKGLGNGFPVGACIAVGQAADLLQPGSHGSTFGGNPVAAAAANAVLDELESGVLDNVRRVGDWFAGAVEALQHPLIDNVRGRGLLRGIVLTTDIAPGVVDAALEAGWVINAPRPNVLRIAPPLVITREQLQPFVDALPGLLETASG